jgi:hypothetical protein
MSSGGMIYIPKFNKNWFGHAEFVEGGEYTYINTTDSKAIL